MTHIQSACDLNCNETRKRWLSKIGFAFSSIKMKNMIIQRAQMFEKESICEITSPVTYIWCISKLIFVILPNSNVFQNNFYKMHAQKHAIKLSKVLNWDSRYYIIIPAMHFFSQRFIALIIVERDVIFWHRMRWYVKISLWLFWIER